MKLSITYQPDGSYFIESGDSDSLGLEVKAVHLGHRDFRVEADGLSMDVCLAVYTKGRTKHFHIWHGKHHHHFRQIIGLELSNDTGSQHKPSFEIASQ